MERERDPFLESVSVRWLWPTWREGSVAGGTPACAHSSWVYGKRELLWCRKFKLQFVCITNGIQVLIREHNLFGESKIKGTLVFLSEQFCLHCAVW